MNKSILKTGFLSVFLAAALLLGGQLGLHLSSQEQNNPKGFGELSKQMLTIAQAHAHSDETLLQTVRLFYRLGMGMTQADFNLLKMEVPEIEDITGVDGLVGELDRFRKNISESILANNPSVKECSDVPSSGLFTANGITVKFATAKHNAPTGYPSGGGSVYDKRLELTQVNGTKTITSVFEFNCNVAASMLAYEFADSSNTDINHKMAIFYDGEIFENKNFQFYFDWPSEDVHMAVIMKITSAQYNFWISSGKDNGDTGFRMTAIGHRDTGKVSFFADDTTSGGGRNDGDRHEDHGVVGGNAPDDGVPYQGCANNFDHAPEAIASDDLCGSDVLSEGVSALPGVSDLATKTVFDNIESGIDALLAP